MTCKNKKGMKALPPALHACVLTEEQLEAALAAGIGRIYISTDILAAQSGKIGDRKRGKNPCNSTGILKNRKKPDTEIYLALPYIIRMRDTAFLGALRRMLEEGLADGVLVRNLEELAWLKEISCPGDIVTDTGMYLYNSAAFSVFEKESAEQYLPLELNCHESEELLKAARGGRLSEMVYGRIPMMISAGCVAATMGDCKEISDHGGGKRVWMLTDRCRKSFPVYLNCRHCYNVIYNSLPLSLHSHMDRIKDSGLSCVRLDFTVEDRQETESILSFFQEILACTGKNVSVTPPFGEYTGGHFKRGVE